MVDPEPYTRWKCPSGAKENQDTPRWEKAKRLCGQPTYPKRMVKGSSLKRKERVREGTEEGRRSTIGKNMNKHNRFPLSSWACPTSSSNPQCSALELGSPALSELLNPSVNKREPVTPSPFSHLVPKVSASVAFSGVHKRPQTGGPMATCSPQKCFPWHTWVFCFLCF